VNSSHRSLQHFINLLEPGADIECQKDALLANPAEADIFCEWLHRQKLDSCLFRFLPEIAVAFTDLQNNYFACKQAKLLKRNRRQLIHLFPVLEQFGTEGINVLLFKGAHIASRYYGGIDNRFYGDVDLLVEEADLTAAEQILRSTGACLRNPLPFGRLLTFRHIHALDYRSEDLSYDLHWRVSDFFHHKILSRDLVGRSTYIKLENRELRVPGDADALMIVLLQIFRDAARGIFQLKSACDVWRILDFCAAGFNWRQFFFLREQEGTAITCAATLGLVLAPCNEFEGLEALSPYLNRYLGPDWRAGSRQFVKFLDNGHGVRSWARSVAGVTPARYAAWWLSSLPFRVATHLPNELKKLRRRARWEKSGD